MLSTHTSHLIVCLDLCLVQGLNMKCDLSFMPLLALGLIGFWLNKNWRRVVLASAPGITVYWPIVCLAAVEDEPDGS